MMLYKSTNETAKVNNKQGTTREENCILIMDNARIHRTDKIKQLLKNYEVVAFTFPLYSPELNKIENTFGRLKNKLSFKNLNNKKFRHVIIEEIKKLN